MKYRKNCRHFRGDRPCQFHKDRGWKCDNCIVYDPLKERILIIKLGAAGDVIRTTSLLHRIKIEWPQGEIWWVTRHPEVLDKYVDNILSFNLENILRLQATQFDTAYGLDKDIEACALMNSIQAAIKKGFFLAGGKPAPINGSAEYKYLTGLDDNLNKTNKQSYLEEIFNICGFKFKDEEYIISNHSKINWNIKHLEGKKIIGLNTGCGKRWRTRLWKVEYWMELAEKLRGEGHEVILLGGEKEDEINKMIQKKSGVLYYGYFPFKDFVGLIDACDLVVSAFTMAMHIAIGLKKKVIGLNSVFNSNEIELYGRGKIIEPNRECKCYYGQKCTNDYFCMDTIKPNKVFNIIKEILNES